jgi:hypothetical protein
LQGSNKKPSRHTDVPTDFYHFLIWEENLTLLEKIFWNFPYSALDLCHKVISMSPQFMPQKIYEFVSFFKDTVVKTSKLVIFLSTKAAASQRDTESLWWSMKAGLYHVFSYFGITLKKRIWTLKENSFVFYKTVH